MIGVAGSSALHLCVLVILAAAAGGKAVAQELFLTVGTEIDDEGGYLLLGNLAGDAGERTSWGVGISHADSAAELSGLDTTAYDVSIGHDFGRIGLRFGAGAWSEPGSVDTDRLSAALDFRSGAWLVALEAQRRGSDFDPFRVGTTITRRNGETVTVNALASCSLDDVGLGVRVGYSADRWRVVLSGMRYDYDEARCSFDSPLLGLLGRANREEFVQLAGVLTRNLSIGARTRVLAETSFLDSRVGARISYRSGRRSYEIGIDRAEDAFFATDSTTLSGGIVLPLRDRHELEVHAGLTDGGELGSIGFVGFMAYLAL